MFYHRTRLTSLYVLTLTFLFYIASFCKIAFGRVHEYETTRLKSTAGAGVASILMDESAVLNPAPVAFFDVTSFYIQKFESQYSKLSDQNDSISAQRVSKQDDTYGIILADAKSNLKGAISYQKQAEWNDERTRLSASMASVLGKSSSMGIMYRWTKDYMFNEESLKLEDNYHQMVFGVTHAVGSNLTFGATIVDPLRKKSEDVKAIVGSQLLFQNIISLMADIGANYSKDIEETFLYRAAFQLNIFSDLYLRAGVFRDKGLQEKGNGLGAGWITPKLVIDFAIKNTKPLLVNEKKSSSSKEVTTTQTYLSRNDISLKEVSFSLSYRF